jgi:hypothetical protein
MQVIPYSSYQESNRSGPFSSLTTRSWSYVTWLLINRGGLAPILIQRAHLGNRASIILVQERKAVEVPGGLDTVAADLEAISETQADAGSVISRKLWLICSRRNVTSIHPSTAIKYCVQEVVSNFIAKIQLDNLSASTTLSNNIRLTLQHMYSTGILRTHYFAALIDAFYYCMHEWLDDILNG